MKETYNTRACLKNHFRNLRAPLCGIFYPHSVAVARYAALIRIKSPTNWDSQLTKSLFQTRSSTTNRICRTGFHAEKGADRMLNIFYGDMKEAVYNTAAYFKYDYEDS